MKKITDREYKEFLKYKAEKNSGRLITMDLLRIICGANNDEPEAIGKEILNIVEIAKIAGSEK